MKDDNKTKKQLISELTELRSQNAALKKSMTGTASAELVSKEAGRYAESIVETVREPLLVMDADLKIISANRSFYRTFKVTPGETIGRFIYDIGNRQWDIPKLRELLEKILPEKEAFDDFEVAHDFQVIGHKTMLLNARETYRKDTDAKIILLAFEDITERKRLESLLTESEERYRHLFETASDGIVLFEKREGKITHANQAVEKMLGYSLEESVGKKLQDIGIVDIDDFQTIMQILKEIGITHYTDVPIKTKSGQHIDTDIYLVDRAKLVQCNIRDITYRMRIERSLVEKEARLRTLVQTIPDLIWLKDADGVYLACNTRFERFFGAKETDIVGKTDYDFVDKELADFFRAHDRKAMAAGKPGANEEWLTFADDGYRGLFDTIKTPMYDAEGKLIGVLGIARDITERKQAEEEHKAHIRFLESLERIDQAIKQETDVEQMLRHILQTVFSIFDCDRAWLFYPCDPDAPTFRVPMEICRPEYPGAKVLNVDVPMSPDMAQNLREALASDDPVIYIAGTEKPINKVTAKQFGVQSQMFVALYPKLGKPWVFGMHQCSYPRIWTEEEQKLFKEISRRISDGLSGALYLRELQENEARLSEAQRLAKIGSWEWDAIADTITWSEEYYHIYGFDPTQHPPGYEEHLKAYTPESAVRLDAAVKRNLQTGETYEVDLELANPKGPCRWITARSETMHDAQGKIIGLRGTAQDITERMQAEDVLRISEERYRMAEAIGHVGNWEYNLQTTKFWGSDEAKRIYGFDPKALDFSTDEVENCIPERERVHQALVDLIEADKPYNLEFEIHPKNSLKPRIISSVAALKRDEHGNPLLVTGLIQDITARKWDEEELIRVNRALRMLSDTNQALIRSTDEATLLNEVCRISVEVGGYRLAWVGFAEHDEAKTVRPVAHAGFESGYIESANVTWADNERGRGPGGTAIRTGQPCIARNIPVDPAFAPWQQAAIQRGYKSNIALPLISEGQTLGELAIYSVETDAFDTKEVEILKELVDDLAFGITALRTRAKRDLAEEAMREINEQLSLALEVGNAGVWEWYLKSDEIRLDDRFHAMLGYTPGELPNTLQEWLLYHHPEDIPVWMPKAEAYLRGDSPLYESEHRIRNKAGTWSWVFTRGKLVNLTPTGSPEQFIGIAMNITEHKQAEEALHAANMYNRSLIEASLDPLVTIGADGKITDVNTATEAATGYTRIELIGTEFPGYFTEPEQARAGYEEVFRTGFVRDYPLELRHRDGHVTSVLYNASVYRDEKGQVAGVFAVARDITERKQADEALSNSEGRLHALVQTIPDLIWLKDKDGVYLSCNTMFERFFGAREADIVGKSDYDFVDRELADFFREHDRKAMAAGKPTSNEEWITFADDGHRALLDTIKTPMYDARGTLVGVLGIGRDITERKRAEDMLRISEERYRMAEAIGHVGNWEYNLQTTKVWGSDEAKRIYGFDPEALDFSTDEVENCIPERERVHQALVDLIEADKPYNLEFEIYPKNSLKPRIISSVAALKRDEHGNPLLATGLIQDITERKQAEDEIRNLNAELEQRVIDRTVQLEIANKELDAFVYSISHDLKAPLRSVDGYVQILIEDHAARLDSEGKRVCEVISNNARTMGQLIDSLLALSRTGRIEMNPAPVDMATLANSIFFELTTPEGRERIDFRVGPLPRAVGDPTLLRQVWVNLIGNAAKFSAQKERAVIEVGCLSESIKGKPAVVYFVRDNGAGFDMAYADKLFGVFQRLHSAKEFEGTGVGLAIVQRIVQRHGGRIWAEGEPGKGATFYFTLDKA